MAARAVVDWFAARKWNELFLSAVSEAELRTGVAMLPAGKRRDRLNAIIDAMIEEDFADRILSFDSAAAKAYAAIAASRRAMGLPIAEADCQIAAIASVRGAAVATRSAGGFERCGIAVIDPWRGPDPR